MKNILIKLVFTLLLSQNLFAQNNMGVGTLSPDASAKLDVSSTTQGFLMPRMTTTEVNAIVSPATGLLVFDVTLNDLQVNLGTPSIPNWTSTSGASITASNGLSITGNDITLGGSLSANTTINQNTNNLTFSGTGQTIVSGSFKTEGNLYSRIPRVHPIAASITWQSDDLIILLQSTHSGQITFPSASANPNRLVGINNRSGGARTIANVTGGDTGIYANESLSSVASNSGVSWYISDGISWRLYSGRP